MGGAIVTVSGGLATVRVAVSVTVPGADWVIVARVPGRAWSAACRAGSLLSLLDNK